MLNSIGTKYCTVLNGQCNMKEQAIPGTDQDGLLHYTRWQHQAGGKEIHLLADSLDK